MKRHSRIAGAVCLAAALAFVSPKLQADPIADFFKDRQVNFIVS